MNMDHKIQVADIGKLIKEERQTIELRRALHNGKAFDHTNYHTYEEVYCSQTYIYSIYILYNKTDIPYSFCH